MERSGSGEGKGTSLSSITLTLPLQVAVDEVAAFDDHDMGLPSFEESETDAFHRQRGLSRQEELAALVRHTSGGLPEYGEI